MSAFEQRVEPPDRRFQYLLFHAEPYECIAFKLPNDRIDKEEGKLVTEWNAPPREGGAPAASGEDAGKFTLTLHFALGGGVGASTEPAQSKGRAVKRYDGRM